MSSESDKLIGWFYRQSWSKEELRFEEQLLRSCQEALGKSVEQSERYVFANRTRIWNALKKKRELDIQAGRRSIFEVTDGVGMKAVWNGQVKSVNKKDSRAEALWRARPNILKEIDSLNDRDYEALGCLVSELSGADKVILTPPGNEGGIDFICRLNMPSKNHIFGGITSPIRIIGQCKKYKSRVGVDKIREFAKTMDDVRHNSRHLENIVPHWFYGGKGPIIGWMIGHSGFQSGSITISNNQGILLSDSLDLSEVIASSRIFHENLKPDKRAKELSESLRVYY